jgi:hypothetical protein
MKINSKQKNVIFGCLILFLTSAIYVPTEVTQDGTTVSWGYQFIWEIFGEIALKTLLIEWAAIAVIFAALFSISGNND